MLDIEKLKSSQMALRAQTKAQSIGYILTAFGLVAGLAWNDAIKAMIDYLFPMGKDTMTAKFVYAIIITIAIVIVTAILSKLSSKEQEKSLE